MKTSENSSLFPTENLRARQTNSGWTITSDLFNGRDWHRITTRVHRSYRSPATRNQVWRITQETGRTAASFMQTPHMTGHDVRDVAKHAARCAWMGSQDLRDAVAAFARDLSAMRGD